MLSLGQKLLAMGVLVFINLVLILFTGILGVIALFGTIPFAVAVLRL